MTQQIVDHIKTFAAEFDRRFEAYLSRVEDVPEELAEAVRYAALSPGKRLRPFLVMRCFESAGGTGDGGWPVAAAVECVHAFSLIHDDLPAMDNDDLRRGQPTCHMKFGEAMAILAGDALLCLAFQLIADDVADRSLAARLCGELARGAGWAGMIGGQTADVVGESFAPSAERVEYIHNRKTAALFASACRLGALAGGADEPSVARLGDYGRHLGRAFQIADDLLDVTSSALTAGKEVGKDAKAGKQTYPSCFGIEQSRDESQKAVDLAVGCLRSSDPSFEPLRLLAHFVVDRDY